MTKKKEDIEVLLKVFFGALALFALKSIFENDNSKIISKKGSEMLSDTDKMNEFNKIVKKSEDPNNNASYSEIYL